MQRITYLVAIVSSVLGGAGCNRDSATDNGITVITSVPTSQPAASRRFQDRLIGTWEQTETRLVAVHCETTFTPDGHFMFTSNAASMKGEIWVSGTWEVVANKLIEHVKDSNFPAFKHVGSTVSEIVGLTRDEFEYVDATSQKRYVAHRLQASHKESTPAESGGHQNS